MNERIWVNPDGLRVRGRGQPGGHWEDGGHEGDFVGSLVGATRVLQDCMEDSRPSRSEPWGHRWLAIKSLAAGLMRPVPCLSVWAGMVGTYFWNAFRSLPDQPLAGLVELPDEWPNRILAAGVETGVFLVWTLCFRSTIRSAIRKEFDNKA